MSDKLKRIQNPALKNKLFTVGIVAAFYLVSILLSSAGMTSNKFRGLLVPVSVYVILAVSLNLTVGILGELSLGHAGFMCVGAYVGSTVSLLLQDTVANGYLRFPIALICGGIAAGIFGFLIGIPVLRLRGDYLAIVTLAFGEVIKTIVRNLYIAKDINGLHISLSPISEMGLDDATKQVIINGAQGITGTPNDSKLWVAALLVLFTVVIVMNIVDSRAGRAFMSIRDNVVASESLGVKVTKYKLMAFTVSAVFAGFAGVLYSHNLHTLDPGTFDYNLSIMILVYVVLGGIGSIRGSIIATALLYALPEYLRFLRDYRMLIYAVILIAVMILGNNKRCRDKLQDIRDRLLSFLPKKKKKGEKA